MMAQPVCKQCGQFIIGNYLTALDATWHPTHFICAACHRPLEHASFVLHNGAPYHEECYRNQILPRCVYCNKPLVGEYLIDYWGNQFCKEHKQQYPTCQFCGRLIPPQQQEQGSELQRCPICRARAVEQDVVAKPLYAQTISWVSSQGLIYNSLRLSLVLYEQARLAELLKHRHSPHSLGATSSTSYTENGQVVRTEINGIAILLGVPTPLFQSVTVHELGHVWLAVHGIQGLPAWAEEGFCELLSYRYLIDIKTSEGSYYAQRIEQNPDPIYGGGFRHIHVLADSLTFTRFLELLRTTKHLPRL